QDTADRRTDAGEEPGSAEVAVAARSRPQSGREGHSRTVKVEACRRPADKRELHEEWPARQPRYRAWEVARLCAQRRDHDDAAASQLIRTKGHDPGRAAPWDR